MTKTNPIARDDARGSDLIVRLIDALTMAPDDDDMQAIRDGIAELERHLCECGHWMREHGVKFVEPKPQRPCYYGDCGCRDFKEESDE